MPLAVPTGRMVIAAIRHPATQATIDTLALGSQPAIAAYLLIVAEAISLGDLGLFAMLHQTAVAPAAVFAFGSQPAMATDLLVVSGAVSSGTGFTPTPIGLTDQPPFAYDDIPFAALRSHHHLIPRFLRGDNANIIPP